MIKENETKNMMKIFSKLTTPLYILYSLDTLDIPTQVI